MTHVSQRQQHSKRMLIINQRQFGYHSDTYYYCKYLYTDFSIAYICWDYKDPKINLNGIHTIYISRKGNIVIRNIRFMKSVIKEIKKGYHIHFIKYFKGCSLIKIIYSRKTFLLDIRSSTIEGSVLWRSAFNLLITIESNFFKHISAISNSLVKKLGLPKRTFILPIGADVISAKEKTFNSLHLLYVGTLFKRNIDQTIKGFSKFYHNYKDKIHIHYTIVGSGETPKEQQRLKALVRQENLTDAVNIAGQIPHDRLKSFFENHNVGISYIPKTDFFNAQPPTKTFEYLLSGMPVLATNTLENKIVIHRYNGVLIDDNPEAFFQGLAHLYQNRKQYDSNAIRYNISRREWVNIAAILKQKVESL